MKSRLLKMLVAAAFTLGVCFLGYAEGKDLVKANIPQIYGKAKDAFTGNSGKTIIHIQDAHGNAESQENIQAIVKSLAEQGKIDAIADEGGWNTYNMNSYQKLNEEQKATVVDWETKYGLVHGASRYMVLEDNKAVVFGSETKELYNEGKKTLKDSFASAKENAAAATTIKASMEALKLKLFDEETRNLLQAMDDFQNDKITLTSFSKVLKSASEKAAVDWKTYANFSKVIESVTLEDAIDFAKIDRERLDMVDALEGAVEKKSADEIVNNSLNYRLGRMSAADYYAFLLSKAGEAKIDMAKYDNVAKYAQLVKVYAEINDDALFAETSRLEAEIKAKMFKNESQVNFDKHLKGLDVLNRMINLQMTRADLAYFNENKPKAAELIAFLKEQSKSLNLGIQVDEALSKIDESLSSNVKFYEIALKRDEAMIENTLAMMDERGFKTVVLVAGGFHTEGIMKSLKAKNISHNVVTPRITNPDAPNYWKQLMTGEETEATQVLKKHGMDYFSTTTMNNTDKNNGTSTMIYDEAFVADIQAGKDVTAATVLDVDGYLKDKVISDLAKVDGFPGALKALNDAIAAKGFKETVEFKVIGETNNLTFNLNNRNQAALRQSKDGKHTIYLTEGLLNSSAKDRAILTSIMNNEIAEISAEKGKTGEAAINAARMQAMASQSREHHAMMAALLGLQKYAANNVAVGADIFNDVMKATLGKVGNLDKALVSEINTAVESAQNFTPADIFGKENAEQLAKNLQEISTIAQIATQSVAGSILKSMSSDIATAQVNASQIASVAVNVVDLNALKSLGDSNLSQLNTILNLEAWESANANQSKVHLALPGVSEADAQTFADEVKSSRGLTKDIQLINMADFDGTNYDKDKLVVLFGEDSKVTDLVKMRQNIAAATKLDQKAVVVGVSAGFEKFANQIKGQNGVVVMDAISGTDVLSRLTQMRAAADTKAVDAFLTAVQKYAKVENKELANQQLTKWVNGEANSLNMNEFLNVTDALNILGKVDPYVGKYA